MKSCLFCGAGFIPHPRAIKTRLYCSAQCRRAYDNERQKAEYRQSKICSFCNEVYDWAAFTKYCSNRCKQMAENYRRKQKNSKSNCVICKKPVLGSYGFIRKYCSKSCKHIGMFGGKPPLEERSRKAQRNFRERNVGGLSTQEIRNLRATWISQGQSCSYCDKACETVDHIVPLNRGGDNQLKNLTPACRSCNSSKGDRLLSEWGEHDRRKTKKADRVKTLIG